MPFRRLVLRICSVEGCDRAVVARGMCSLHYQRLMRHGHPASVLKTERGKVARYFVEAVVPYDDDACLLWPFCYDQNGYARIKHKGRATNVHAAICEHRHGSPPTPKHVAAHSCGNGDFGCVNPNHVRWATRSENMAHRRFKRKRLRLVAAARELS